MPPTITHTHTYSSFYSSVGHSRIQIPTCPNFHISHEFQVSRFFFFFSRLTVQQTMAAFQDFKVPGGRVESGLMGGMKEKKNQGKRLGLIRDFLCEINRLGSTASSGCGTCGVTCNWTLSPKTVIRTFPRKFSARPAFHVRRPSVTS